MGSIARLKYNNSCGIASGFLPNFLPATSKAYTILSTMDSTNPNSTMAATMGGKLIRASLVLALGALSSTNRKMADSIKQILQIKTSFENVRMWVLLIYYFIKDE